MSKEKEIPLKCPFCGELPKVGHGKAKCVNDKCRIKVVIKDWFVDDKDAVEVWNKRA